MHMCDNWGRHKARSCTIMVQNAWPLIRETPHKSNSPNLGTYKVESKNGLLSTQGSITLPTKKYHSCKNDFNGCKAPQVKDLVELKRLVKQYVRKVESNNWAAKPPTVWSRYPPPGRVMHTKYSTILIVYKMQRTEKNLRKTRVMITTWSMFDRASHKKWRALKPLEVPLLMEE